MLLPKVGSVGSDLLNEKNTYTLTAASNVARVNSIVAGVFTVAFIFAAVRHNPGYIFPAILCSATSYGNHLIANLCKEQLSQNLKK